MSDEFEAGEVITAYKLNKKCIYHGESEPTDKVDGMVWLKVDRMLYLWDDASQAWLPVKPYLSGVVGKDVVEVNEGINVFKDSVMHYDKVVLITPSGITGMVYLACDNVARGILPTSNLGSVSQAGEATNDVFVGNVAYIGSGSSPGGYMELDIGTSKQRLLVTKWEANGGSFTLELRISPDGTSWQALDSTSTGQGSKIYYGIHDFRYIRYYVSQASAAGAIYLYECQAFDTFAFSDQHPSRLEAIPVNKGKHTIDVIVPAGSGTIGVRLGNEVISL